MESTLEGGEQLHRVKRGRPAKAAYLPTKADGYVDVEKFVEGRACKTDAELYALRVWHGQSVDVPRHERIERCMNALRGQNLPTDGIVFPT